MPLLRALGALLLAGRFAASAYLGGVVFDPARKPIGGAVVKLVGIGSDTTSDSGEFRIPIPDTKIGERATITVSKDGWAPAHGQLLTIIVPKDPASNPFTIVMVPARVFASSAKPNEPLVEFSAIVETPEDAFSIAYQWTRTPGLLSIVPQLPYLDLFRRGGPITTHRYWWTPFKLSLPQLDIKVVNNTNNTVFFTEALFQIDRSALDPSPLLLIPREGYHMRMMFRNFGWKPVSRAEVKCNLLQPDAPIDFDKPPAYSAVISEEQDKEYLGLDLSEAFARAGVDVETVLNEPVSWSGSGRNRTYKIRQKDGTELTLDGPQYDERMQKALGPFPKGAANVVGEIIYDDPAHPGEKRSVKFHNIVYVGRSLPGAPAPPSFTYSVKFDVDGQKYERRVPISQALKPKDFDRFTIRIGADRSSTHRFRLRLTYNNGRFIDSPPIDLGLLMPRGSERFLSGPNDPNR